MGQSITILHYSLSLSLSLSLSQLDFAKEQQNNYADSVTDTLKIHSILKKLAYRLTYGSITICI